MKFLKECTVKVILIFAVVTAFSCVYANNVLQLAAKGKTEYVIVEGANAIPAEKHAAKELSSYLQKMTGAKFPVIAEKDAANAKFAIYVGATDFAAKQGIKQNSIGDEEWIVRTVGKNLIVTGGRPRGVLYGAYEFLERLGCAWFDPITESVPSKPELAVSPFSVRRKPAFKLRMVFTGESDTRAVQQHNARVKSTRTWLPEFGFIGEAPGHTFYFYSKQFPKDHPEYHAMNASGERPVATSGSGPGQICLSNPEVRKLMVQLLIKNIEATNKSAAKNIAQGARPRQIYYVTPNDNAFNCQCPPCKAFMKKEGTDSALYVDFINSIADGIKAKYPDILIGFFAYENNLVPPKRIRPRDNTIVCFAQLNAEWKKKDEFPDLYRPMTHPVNSKAKVLLEQWTKIAKNVEIWDYWVQFVKNKYPFPNATLDAVVADIKWFQKNNVDRIFTECEPRCGLSFYALTCWVARKMMDNPDQDPKKLVSTFMKGYYGPAAGKMTEYLDYLQKSIAATPAKDGKICALLVSERSYLNLNFYKKVSAMLDAAEKSCAPGSLYLLNVQQERILVDAGIYCMWEKLQKQLPKGQKMPWKAADILQRFKKYRLAELKARPYLMGFAPKVKEKFVEDEVTKLKGYHAAGKGGKPLVMTVPRKNASTPGDPAAADWNNAASLSQWFSVEGNKVPERKISGKILFDSQYLYLLLEEKGLDLSKLNPQWWSGDAWEIFFSSKRSGVPYKQLAINSDGKQYAFAYTDNMANQTVWKSGAVVKTEKKDGCWKTLISIPLSSLLDKKEIENGNPVFMNIFRPSKHLKGKVMCISPIFDASYHDMTNLAEMRPEMGWPAKENNLVFGKAYTLSKKPNWKLCANADQALEMKKLTDGVFNKGKTPMWFNKKATQGFTLHGNIEVTFDLGKTASVENVFVHSGAGIAGVELPRFVEVKTSMDGKKYTSVGKVNNAKLGNVGYRAESISVPVKKTDARFVKVVLNVIHWYLCMDEIAVQGQWK